MAKYVIPHRRKDHSANVRSSFENQSSSAPTKRKKYIPPPLRHAMKKLEEDMFGLKTKEENPNIIEHKWSHKAVAERTALDF